MEQEIAATFTYKTWLRCISVTCTPCGHTHSFDSRRHDGTTADMSEIFEWMAEHAETCRQRRKEEE